MVSILSVLFQNTTLMLQRLMPFFQQNVLSLVIKILDSSSFVTGRMISTQPNLFSVLSPIFFCFVCLHVMMEDYTDQYFSYFSMKTFDKSSHQKRFAEAPTYVFLWRNKKISPVFV